MVWLEDVLEDFEVVLLVDSKGLSVVVLDKHMVSTSMVVEVEVGVEVVVEADGDWAGSGLRFGREKGYLSVQGQELRFLLNPLGPFCS